MTDDDIYYIAPVKRPPSRVLAIVLAAVALGLLGFAVISKRWLYNPKTVLEVREGEAKGARFGAPHEIGFGVRGMFVCIDECESFSNGEFLGEWRKQLLVLRYSNGESVQDELEAAGGEELVRTAKLQRMRVMDASGDTVSLMAHAELAIAREVLVQKSGFVPLGWVTLIGTMLGGLALFASLIFVLAKRRLAWPVMPTTVGLVALSVVLFSGCVFVAMKPGPAGYLGVSFGFMAFGLGTILGITATLFLNRLLRPEDPDLLEDAMKPDQF